MRINNSEGMQNIQTSKIQSQQKSESAKIPDVQQKKDVHVSKKDHVANEEANMPDEMLDKAVEQANKSLKAHDRVIERSVHDVTKTVMYAVKDSETNEIIAEFPPKKIQDMIAKMWELAGLFVDEKA